MARVLSSRIKRLEARYAPKPTPKLTPVIRVCPKTGTYLDPTPNGPHIPEPHFPTTQSWEAYNLETRAALVRYMPEQRTK